jgi:hypothetical protein
MDITFRQVKNLPKNAESPFPVFLFAARLFLDGQ